MILQQSTLFVDVGRIAAGYTKAGQYVQIKVGDSKPGFYAIASPPDPNNAGVVELLVKNLGGTSELLCQAQPGARDSLYLLAFLGPAAMWQSTCLA